MDNARSPMPALVRSLSARLLVLTILFVMLAEVFIFVPSIARFRASWFAERISAAHLATMALEAAPAGMISRELEKQLLAHVQAHGVILQKPDSKVLMLSSEMPPEIDETVDLRGMGTLDMIVGAGMTALRTGNRVLRVIGPSPRQRDAVVQVVLDEAPLRYAMLDYGWRILWLSVVISVFTAVLVFFTLRWLMVSPMRRITGSMVAFREDPTDPEAAIVESGRSDEIGVAEHELAAMQARLRAALRQREHLAALGEAVAKINHDLRNMLATAALVSERLADSDDPQVQRATPTLERALNRAVALCGRILNYAQGAGDINPERVDLAQMLAEIPGEVAEVGIGGKTSLDVSAPEGFTVTADRNQLFRVFANLVKNAADAGARHVAIELVGTGPAVIEVRDDGPGMPERAIENLFRPFTGSGRSGGTGLGLAIAREIVEAHGGSIVLAATGESGTTFRLTLPEIRTAAVRAAQ